MRTVFKTAELPHQWAHQLVPKGRSSSNQSFEGVDYYSYNTVIASIVFNDKGEQAYLVSTGKYSVSTSSHQSYVCSAIPIGARKFFVPGVERGGWHFSTPIRILRAWAEQFDGLLVESSKSRNPKRDRLRLEACALVDTMTEYAAWIGEDREDFVVPAKPMTDAEVTAILAAQSEKRAALWIERERKEEEQLAEHRVQFADARTAWLTGVDNALWMWSHYFDTELRVAGGFVETSRGVSFPVSHARRGLTLVRNVIASGKEWRTNGHTLKLGAYGVDKVTTDGTVYAGCHVVKLAAIERIAAELDAAATSAGVDEFMQVGTYVAAE